MLYFLFDVETIFSINYNTCSFYRFLLFNLMRNCVVQTKHIQPVVDLQPLDANLGDLTAKFVKATAEKMKRQQEGEATTLTINLASRLVGGLASENVRWAEAVSGFKEQVKIIGIFIARMETFLQCSHFFNRIIFI